MAIEQVSVRRFSFSFKRVPPLFKWGNNPVLDQSGATSHLTSTTVYDDEDKLNWINKNTKGIVYVSSARDIESGRSIIEFYNDEDAMFFKLTWL